jgi:hypothetical protein
MSVGVMTVGVMSVGEITVGVITGTRIPDPPFSSFGPSRDYDMDLFSGSISLNRRSFFKTGALLYNIESKRGFPLCISTIVSYLYVYISNTAAGPRNKS